MGENVVQGKSYSFALKIIALHKKLKLQNDYVIGHQLLKSGTSIGANVEEALAGQSRADFLSKMSIASKEARESGYWLRLLRDSGSLDSASSAEYLSEIDELIRLLTSIVKTTSSRK